MPAFGFSVGDFIAAIELCNKISKALKDTDGASSDFANVAIELHGLENVLRRVVALDPNASNIEHVDAIRSLALSCQIPIQEFLAKLQAYESALGPIPTRKFQAGRKLQWAFHKVEEVNKMRALVSARTESINLRLAMHSSEALSRLEASSEHYDDVLVRLDTHRLDLGRISNQMEGTKKELSDQISATAKPLQQKLEDVAQQSSDTRLSVVSLTAAFASLQGSFMGLRSMCLEMLAILQKLPTDLLAIIREIQSSNVQIYALLLKIASSVPASPTWLLSSNIRFEDALGVIWELPYEYFKHWEIFQSMLSCKFKDRPGERNIRSGRYFILNSKIPGEIVAKEDWNLVVQPGVHLYMSMGLVRFYNKSASCPRPGCMGDLVPTQSRSIASGISMKCKQCGLHSTRPAQVSEPLVLRAPSRAHLTIDLKRTKGFNKVDGNPTSTYNLALCTHGRDKYQDPHRVPEHTTLRNIAALKATVKAIVYFRRLLARLRRREEQELKAFKTVHVKHETDPDRAPWTMPWTKSEFEQYRHLDINSKLAELTYIHDMSDADSAACFIEEWSRIYQETQSRLQSWTGPALRVFE